MGKNAKGGVFKSKKKNDHLLLLGGVLAVLFLVVLVFYFNSTGLAVLGPSRAVSNIRCTDSDGGKSFYVFGKTTVYKSNNTSQSFSDSCSGSTLTEYYCSGKNSASVTNSCTSGCTSGACIQSSGIPAAPSSLSASVASTTVGLSWTDNSSNETGFKVEYASTSSGPWTQLASVGEGVASYSQLNSSVGTYYYRVGAYNSSGTSYSSTASATVTVSSPPSSGVPRGIYMLDDKTGSYRLGTLPQANQPYIDGFVWRIGWTSLDTGTGGAKYNFTPIVNAITQLQALSNDQNNRMKITIALNAQQVPTYVLNGAKEKFNTTLPGGSGTALTVVPWDANSIQSYRNFFNAMASYSVYDKFSDRNYALKDHPAVGQINAGVLGLQSVRDISGVLTTQSGYTRDKFVSAILQNVHAAQDAFPNKPVYIAYFSMKDSNRSPTLDSHLVSALNAEFNGVAHPHIGFFQENLRGDAPKTNDDLGENLLTARAGGNYVMFQACGSWLNHSNCTFTSGDDSPANGFSYGYNSFGARYFEMYVTDLQYSGFLSVFQQWHTTLQTG